VGVQDLQGHGDRHDAAALHERTDRPSAGGAKAGGSRRDVAHRELDPTTAASIVSREAKPSRRARPVGVQGGKSEEDGQADASNGNAEPAFDGERGVAALGDRDPDDQRADEQAGEQRGGDVSTSSVFVPRVESTARAGASNSSPIRPTTRTSSKEEAASEVRGCSADHPLAPAERRHDGVEGGRAGCAGQAAAHASIGLLSRSTLPEPTGAT
jgi:hypothetical protein